MKRRRPDVERSGGTGRRRPARLLHHHRHGVGLVHQPELALGCLGGGGVDKHAALQKRPVDVGHHRADVPQAVAVRVREGAPISKSLAESKLFPPMMIHLISSGEAGGRLEEMLTRAAVGQEREVDGLIATLLGILQPLVIVLMGGIVLTIVLAILLPIFEINNLIR